MTDPKFPPDDAIMAGVAERIERTIDRLIVARADVDEVKEALEQVVVELRKMRQQAQHWKFFQSLDAPNLRSLIDNVDFRLLVAVMTEAGPETRTRWRRALDAAQRMDGRR